MLVCGQGPGIEEDGEGLPWIGQAGQWLTSLLDVMGLHSSMIYWTNIIKCFPGRKRGKGGGDNEPPPYAVEACKGYLIEEKHRFGGKGRTGVQTARENVLRV